MSLTIMPVTLKVAQDFVERFHRHNEKPVGHKFSIGVARGGRLVGVVVAGRPVNRHLDDGFTLEVTRTCTDSTPNANSMLYGAAWRAARAMGYLCCTTYTQHGESGASLRAAGFVKVAELPARKSWRESSVKLAHTRALNGTGGVARQRWEIRVRGVDVSSLPVFDDASEPTADPRQCALELEQA